MAIKRASFVNPINILNYIIRFKHSSVGEASHSSVSIYTHARKRTMSVTAHQHARAAGVRERDPIHCNDCISQKKQQSHHQQSNNTAIAAPITTRTAETAVEELTIDTKITTATAAPTTTKTTAAETAVASSKEQQQPHHLQKQ